MGVAAAKARDAIPDARPMQGVWGQNEAAAEAMLGSRTHSGYVAVPLNMPAFSLHLCDILSRHSRRISQ